MMSKPATGNRTGRAWPSAQVPEGAFRKLSHFMGRVGLYLLLLFFSLLFALPFFWLLSTSLKDDPQTYHVPPIWVPNPVRWRNYPEALTFYPFGHYVLNTLQIAVLSAVGVVTSSALTAYGFSRIRWRARDTLFFICVATLMLPFQVRMIPLYITFKTIGWLNTFLPLIVPRFFGGPYYIFMLRQFFLTIPQELSDAARVDGCSELGILWRIILPLARPALAVVALFEVMSAWNNYIGPLIYINDRTKFTVALGLQQFRSGFTAERLLWPYLMAASTAVILPILFLFFFTQRTFIEGITVTGIKG